MRHVLAASMVLVLGTGLAVVVGAAEPKRDEAYYTDRYEDPVIKEMKDADKALAYMERWIYGVPDHEAYLDLVGRDHLETLRLGKGV